MTTTLSAPVLDGTIPCSHRMANHWRSENFNFAADRIAARDVEAVVPGVARAARASATFERRVLEHLANAEVGQVVHLGHGYPTPTAEGGLDWERVQDRQPGTPVVLVSTDSTVYTQSEALVHASAPVVTLRQDHLSATVLDHPQVQSVIDPTRSVAVLLTSLHHQQPAPDLTALVTGLATRLAPGSLIALSHLAAPARRTRHRLTRLMNQTTRGRWGKVRAPGDIAALLLGLERVGSRPGDVAAWTADGHTPPAAQRLPSTGPAPRVIEYGGVVRVPHTGLRPQARRAAAL
ncbi:SAM-dependent methyltransferase [Kitasatospora sp. NPDC058046]|uniref:SAM-dependent methyltransferase n=1 Tax=Kitasatospora sp. NPDC058046 TaxID=3346312 RepID=UPI0036DBFBD6